jgi:hypothetical protein
MRTETASEACAVWAASGGCGEVSGFFKEAFDTSWSGVGSVSVGMGITDWAMQAVPGMWPHQADPIRFCVNRLSPFLRRNMYASGWEVEIVPGKGLPPCRGLWVGFVTGHVRVEGG